MASGRVKVLQADAWSAKIAEAPFDAIHVGAAASKIPPILLKQLKVILNLYMAECYIDVNIFRLVVKC